MVASHSSFPVGSEQDVTKPAPYIEDKVVEPVTVSLEIVVVAKEEVPVAVRLATDVEASTELPVTVSELALVTFRLVVPVAVRLVVDRFDVLALFRLD